VAAVVLVVIKLSALLVRRVAVVATVVLAVQA